MSFLLFLGKGVNQRRVKGLGLVRRFGDLFIVYFEVILFDLFFFFCLGGIGEVVFFVVVGEFGVIVIRLVVGKVLRSGKLVELLKMFGIDKDVIA